MATFTWTDGNGSWTVAGNWSPASVPNGASANVLIADGTSTVTLSASVSVDSLQLASGNALEESSGSVLTVGAQIDNAGTILIAAGANNAALNTGGPVSLTGGGTMILSNGTGGNQALISQSTSGSPLTNVDNTIEGFGQIGVSGLVLVNEGTVDANVSGQTLILSGGTGTNSGVLEATSSGALSITTSVNNTGGDITADGATVAISNSAVITAGTLNTSGGGTLESVGGGVVLNGVTISSGSTYNVSSGSSTQLVGTIDNAGTILVAAGDNNAGLDTDGPVSLTGDGTVILSNATSGFQALIAQSVASSPLTNVDNTIEGSGQIGGAGGLALVNEGNVDANAPGQTLTLSGGGVTNLGLLEATGSGALSITTSVTNIGGDITADGATVAISNSAVITGGTLNTSGGGTLESAGGTETLNGVTISSGSTYTIGSGGVVQIEGTIDNAGTILIAAGSNNAALDTDGTVSLTGGGTVILSNGTSGNQALISQSTSGSPLTNVDDTIEGFGQIGVNGLVLVNEGTVDANVSGQTLILSGGAGTNSGVLEATDSGALSITTSVNNSGGDITADGATVAISNSAVITGGTLNTLGGGTLESVGGTETLNGVTISCGSTYTIGNGGVVQIEGTIDNAGTILIAAGSNNAALDTDGTVSLTGGGTVILSNGTSGNQALISQSTSGSPLTNVDNTIEGFGQIGVNGLVLVNEGTVDANAPGQTLTLSGGGVTNLGLLEASNGGLLDVTGAIAGGGQLEIGAGSEIELGGAASETATFTGATNAKLRLDVPGIHTGTIANFAAGMTLELANSSAITATPTLNGANTTLTVKLSGGGTLTYTLAGNLTSDVFTVTQVRSDSDITATPQLAGQISLAAATEGVVLAGTTTLATFTDTNASDTAGSFTATINWGDGTTSAGTVGGSNGAFTVSGGHTYTDEGSFLLGVTVTDTANDAQLPLSGTVVAAEGDVLTPHGLTFTANPNQAFTGTVATFTDSNTSNVASDFTATINWGDGTTTAGVVTDTAGSIAVSGTHTYAAMGQDTVTVSLADDAPGTATATADSTADVGPQLAGQISLAVATEGVALAGTTTLATLTDTNASDTAGSFTATINWGDGTTSAGTVGGSNGAFTVSGGHTYTDEGSFLLGVTVTDTANDAQLPLSGTVVAAEGDVLTPHGLTFTANPNQAFTGTVATFTDSDTSNVAGDFTATINWGDGTTTAGVVTDTAGSIAVSGTHTYAATGQDTVTVSLADDAPGTATATADSTADVGPQLAGQISLAAATEGVVLAGMTTLATFTDTNASDTAGSFTATINWGDGTTSAGTVGGSNGAFTVTGGHTYTDEGSFLLGVTVTDTANDAQLPLSGTVVAAEGDVLTPHGLTFTANPNQAFTGTVATFTDSNTSNVASDFTATINWGDGTTSAGTVGGSNGAFTVSGGHTYTDEGSFLLGVTVTDTANDAQLPLSGTVVAAEGDVLTPHGLTFTANPNQAFTGTVATFTDSDTSNVAGDFTAKINWGDSTTTAGVVTDTAGSIAVSGTHTYAAMGQDTVTVSLADDAPGTATATADSTADVGPQLAGQISLAAATEGVALAGMTTLATFTDTNASDTAGSFTATINWGDGTTSAGTVGGSNGAFTVTGGHTYTDEGSFLLGVTVTDTANDAQLPLSGTVVAAEGDVLTPHGLTFTANPNQTFTGTVATFTDSDTSNVAGDFTATINWGDGTTTAGAVTDTAGSIAVSGTHTYATTGQDTVTVSLADDAPGTATATSDSRRIGPLILGTRHHARLSGSDNVVVGGNTNYTISGEAHDSQISLGDGNDRVALIGGDNTITLGNGKDRVALAGGGNTITLGNGNDTVSVGGKGDNTIMLGSGNNKVTVGGVGNQVSVASGKSTLAASGGSDMFILNGSKASLTLGGSDNMVFLNGGSDTITDTPSGTDALHLSIGATGGLAAILNFSAAEGTVDLASTLASNLGWSMPSQVADALKADHHGGSLLSLGSHGSIDFLNIPVVDLTADNFKIG